MWSHTRVVAGVSISMLLVQASIKVDYILDTSRQSYVFDSTDR